MRTLRREWSEPTKTHNFYRTWERRVRFYQSLNPLNIELVFEVGDEKTTHQYTNMQKAIQDYAYFCDEGKVPPASPPKGKVPK